MDIEKFMQSVPPGKRRSRLEPFRTEIARLEKSGYTNQQIADWLNANGIEVSSESVRTFIRKQIIASHTQSHANNQATSVAKPDAITTLDKKQQRERRADQFIRPEKTNPRLKSILEKLTEES